MRFRLVYEGPLRSLSEEDRDDKKSLRRGTEKQNIRKFFHPQLKELWNTNKLLSTTKIPKGGRQVAIPIDANHGGFSFYSSSKMVASEERPLVDYVADQYPQFGYKFVPLVREKWTLACGLEILFLRRDPPGSLWTAGDIDNRVKTLIDGLRMPKCVAELGDYKDPAADETPFCRNGHSSKATAARWRRLMGACCHYGRRSPLRRDHVQPRFGLAMRLAKAICLNAASNTSGRSSASASLAASTKRACCSAGVIRLAVLRFDFIY